MSADGPGDLVEIQKNLNAEQYVNILNKIILPNVQRRYSEEDHLRIVVEDNSPIHTVRITRAWYENHPEIIRLNWPPRSPDLNVIENLWAEMVRNRRPHIVHKREDLVQRVHLAWADLHQRPDYCQAIICLIIIYVFFFFFLLLLLLLMLSLLLYCQAIVNLMHSRLLAVLASEGDALNY